MKRAFSLVEVIIAIGILGMSMIVLMAIWGPSLRTAEDLIAQSDIEEIVRVADAQIEYSVSWDLFVTLLQEHEHFVYIWKRKVPSGYEWVVGGAWGEPKLSDLRDDFSSGLIVGRPYLIVVRPSRMNGNHHDNIERASHIPAELSLRRLDTVDADGIEIALQSEPVFLYTLAKLR